MVSAQVRTRRWKAREGERMSAAAKAKRRGRKRERENDFSREKRVAQEAAKRTTRRRRPRRRRRRRRSTAGIVSHGVDPHSGSPFRLLSVVDSKAFSPQKNFWRSAAHETQSKAISAIGLNSFTKGFRNAFLQTEQRRAKSPDQRSD